MSTHSSIAQPKVENPDSLIKELKKLKLNDTNAVVLMHKISTAYARSTVFNDSCRVWAELALRLSITNKYERGIASSYYQLGRTKIVMSEFPAAIENFYKALDLYKKLGDSKGIADVNLQVGVIMFNQKSFDDAKSNFESSYQYYQTTTDSFRISMLKYLIGLCYFENGITDKAFPLITDALKIKNLIKDSAGIAECNMALGNLYLSLKQYAKAKQFFEKSNAYYEPGSKDGLIVSTIGLAEIAMADSNYALAESLFTNAYEHSLLVKRKSFILRSAKPLYQFYSTTKQFEKAFYLQDKYRHVLDSIYNFENKQAIEVLHSRFENEKKQLELEVLSRKQQMEKTISYILIALVTLVAAFLYTINKRNRFKIQSEKILTQSNAEIKHLMTELKAAEQQLIQTEKMASLGRLTSGIAHELRNPMNFIANFSQVTVDMTADLLKSKNEPEQKSIADELKANFSRINKHSKRADRIIRSMLLHSRIGEDQVKTVDLNLLCNEFIELAYSGMKSAFPGFECNIFKNMDTELPNVKVIPQDIIRILLNLLNNAFYSVNEKKKSIDGDYIPVVIISTSHEKNFVQVSVKDNGMGIARQYFSKIFTPFFTTKPSGQGIGLGLNICHQVIKSYNGKMIFSTLEGEGTVFTFSVPALSA